MSATLTLRRNPLRHVRSGFLSVAGLRIMTVAVGLGYVKVYTQALGPAEIGVYFYLAALSYVLNAFFFVPIDFYMQARIARMQQLPWPALASLARRVLGIALIACALLSLPLVALGRLSVIDVPALYLAAALLYACMSVRGVLSNRDARVFVASMMFFESFARLAAFLLLTAIWAASARALLYSTIIALALELALVVHHARRRLDLTGGARELDPPRAVFHSAAPVSGAAILNLVQLQAYRVIYPLEGLIATSGLFAVASSVGIAAMSAVGAVFSQWQLPRVYQSHGAYAPTYVRQALILIGVMLLLSLVGAGWVVGLLTKPEYVPFAQAASLGVVAEGANLIIGGVTVYLMLHGRTRKLLAANIAAATLALAGFAIGVAWRPVDPMTIGWSIVASQVVMAGLLLVSVLRPAKTAA